LCTVAGNIALRWSAGRALTSGFYKRLAPLEPGALPSRGLGRAD
jgi:hypothetical protein